MNNILRVIRSVTNNERTAKAVVTALNMNGYTIRENIAEVDCVVLPARGVIIRDNQIRLEEFNRMMKNRESHELDAAVLMTGVSPIEGGGIKEVDWDLSVTDEVGVLSHEEFTQLYLQEPYDE